MWSTCLQVYRPTFTLDHIWLWSSAAFNLCLLPFSSQTKILNQDLVLLIKLWKKSYCPCVVMQLFLGWLLGFLASGQTRSSQISEWQLNMHQLCWYNSVNCLWHWSIGQQNSAKFGECRTVYLPILPTFSSHFLKIQTDLSTRPQDKGCTGCNVYVTCGMTLEACRGCREHSELLNMCSTVVSC